MPKLQKLFKIESYKCYNTFSEHLFKFLKNFLPIQNFLNSDVSKKLQKFISKIFREYA